MNKKYRMEVDTGNGGYAFTNTLRELLDDVEFVHGEKEARKVFDWTKSSQNNDEYVSEDGKMHIWQLPDDLQENRKEEKVITKESVEDELYNFFSNKMMTGDAPEIKDVLISRNKGIILDCTNGKRITLTIRVD